MDAEIKKLSKNLHTISIDDMLDVMGFPTGWKNILNTY